MQTQEVNPRKRQVLKKQEEAARYGLYKARLATDDGYHMFVAKNQYQAKKALTSMPWCAKDAKVLKATHRDCENIAIRALLANGEVAHG